MLVLSRKVGQRIVIGDSIEITIVETSENQTRVGIEAPRSVRVYRKELLDQVAAENVEAVSAAIRQTKESQSSRAAETEESVPDYTEPTRLRKRG